MSGSNKCTNSIICPAASNDIVVPQFNWSMPMELGYLILCEKHTQFILGTTGMDLRFNWYETTSYIWIRCECDLEDSLTTRALNIPFLIRVPSINVLSYIVFAIINFSSLEFLYLLPCGSYPTQNSFHILSNYSHIDFHLKYGCTPVNPLYIEL